MISPVAVLLDKVHDWRRRFWGRFELDDPRPIAISAPYTYFLPTSETLAAIAEGDLAQLVFRGSPPSRDYGAERMWVKVTAVGADGLTGILQNSPADMPQLKHGSVVTFQPWHAISVIFDDPERAPDERPQRQYWERCLVDDCVLYRASRSATSIGRRPKTGGSMAPSSPTAAGASEATIVGSATRRSRRARPAMSPSARC